VFEYFLSVLAHLLVAVASFLVVGVPAAAAASGSSEGDIRLPSGVRLRYREQGPAGGRAVLLLHGYGDSSFSWSRVLPLVPADWRVVTIDHRGHGASDRPASGYAIEDFATDALQAMEALGLKDAAVVGHSMGSFVARRMAERAPDRVIRLVLLGSGPSGDNAVVRDLLTTVSLLSDPVDPAFVRDFQMGTVARPVPAAFMEQIIANSRAVPAHVWKAALTGIVSYRPGPVRMPTLVVGGDADGVFSKAEQEQLAKDIPGASLDLAPGIGHAFNWEDPEGFVASLRRFLAPPGDGSN
jgi:pimeloyl-ACP methyl ester carboxylesterase